MPREVHDSTLTLALLAFELESGSDSALDIKCLPWLCIISLTKSLSTYGHITVGASIS